MNRSDSENPFKRPRKLPGPPQPKPFHITEPKEERGLWTFWLTADDDILRFVQHLPCILQPQYNSPFQRRMKGRVQFCINPRYEPEDAWLWVVDLLETETEFVELNQTWEDALEDANKTEPGDK